jgi:LPXTG-site transpeptidase (sortase) family protein
VSEGFYKRLNVVLLLVAGLLAGYIFISPVVPSIGFYFDKSGDAAVSKNGLKILPVLEGYDQKTFSILEKELSFKENTLVIPTIGVESQIFTSSNSRVLRQGIWHREKTGSPDKGGNFVLAGHRFLYTQGKNTLYFLDKLKTGDQIFVFWEGRRYDYEVETSLVVPAGATEIEAITTQPVLTLYTCTPLYTNKQRLVVRAKLLTASIDEATN